jgi:ATP-dependent Lhr-like helicase
VNLTQGPEAWFSTLEEPIVSVLKTLRIETPTEAQKAAFQPILQGKNILIVAPTGTGKTEAALLPIFSRLLSIPKRKGIMVLYVTPLRALNRDLVKRLSIWSDKLGLRCEVRHGDTTRTQREKQAREPPILLVTTPETLQAILPAKRMRRHLRNVRWVIIDEIHELAQDKRGVQLTIGLERLGRSLKRTFRELAFRLRSENLLRSADF